MFQGFYCVPYYQCDKGKVVVDGAGLVDIRSAVLDAGSSKCQGDLERCCQLPKFQKSKKPPANTETTTSTTTTSTTTTTIVTSTTTVTFTTPVTSTPPVTSTGSAGKLFRFKGLFKGRGKIKIWLTNILIIYSLLVKCRFVGRTNLLPNVISIFYSHTNFKIYFNTIS